MGLTLSRRGFVGLAAGALTVPLLAACGAFGDSDGSPTSDSVSNISSSIDQPGSATTQAISHAPLVIYFSRAGEQYGVGVIDTGNTAIVANMLVDATGADSFEVIPQEDYPYTYDELTDVARQEQSEAARPAYQGDVPDLSQYDTVFIGAPVWWGDWPMIMYTLFDNNVDALSGKTLVPFSTSAGSGLAGFDDKLGSSVPNATIGTGFTALGTDAQNDQDNVRSSVNDWLAGLGY